MGRVTYLGTMTPPVLLVRATGQATNPTGSRIGNRQTTILVTASTPTWHMDQFHSHIPTAQVDRLPPPPLRTFKDHLITLHLSPLGKALLLILPCSGPSTHCVAM